MGYDYPAEDTARRLQMLLSGDKDKIFVAVMNNAVVGYVHACDYDLLCAPGMKNIMDIAVSGEYRRMGIGERCSKALRSGRRRPARPESGSTRMGAHAFYRSMGYDGGEQQIIFKKML